MTICPCCDSEEVIEWRVSPKTTEDPPDGHCCDACYAEWTMVGGMVKWSRKGWWEAEVKLALTTGEVL